MESAVQGAGSPSEKVQHPPEQRPRGVSHSSVPHPSARGVFAGFSQEALEQSDKHRGLGTEQGPSMQAQEALRGALRPSSAGDPTPPSQHP